MHNDSQSEERGTGRFSFARVRARGLHANDTGYPASIRMSAAVYRHPSANETPAIRREFGARGYRATSNKRTTQKIHRLFE